MDENFEKNQNVEEAENTPDTATEETVIKEVAQVKEKKNLFKMFKSRTKRLKNQALLRRGGYSVAITALVLAVLILFNWLVSALSTRFNLEFDMTADKVNSVSKENVEFIKSVKQDVDVIVCATEDNYASYLSSYASSLYGVYAENTDYFDQTVKLVKKYGDLSKNINVKFYDTQSTEFTAVSTKYDSLGLSFGDIIVASEGKDGAERQKKISFTDIYESTDTSGYGYYQTVSGNKIETALTGAIAFVVSGEEKIATLITGHSTSDNTANYVELIKANNYTVNTLSDSIITEIPSDSDLIVIISPTVDFMGSELDAIASFLENDSKYGKGLMYFADASCPYLPNFADFISEWGINVKEGIVYETNDSNRTEEDPSTMAMSNFDTSTNINGNCIVGYGVPMTTSEANDGAVSVTDILTTTETCVTAPVGAAKDWNYSESEKGQYVACALADKTYYDNDDNNKELHSYVCAFSSVQFIQSEWAEYQRLSNKELVLFCTDKIANVGDTGISFYPKTITSETFADYVTATSVTVIRIIFMVLLPIAMIVTGVIVFIRRRNA